jgi:3-hydroxyacyl-[acyl-carrier-protein] dehydratase
MTSEEILSKLPYSKPFLFVDEIIKITENGVEGHFTLIRIFFLQGTF